MWHCVGVFIRYLLFVNICLETFAGAHPGSPQPPPEIKGLISFCLALDKTVLAGSFFLGGGAVTDA